MRRPAEWRGTLRSETMNRPDLLNAERLPGIPEVARMEQPEELAARRRSLALTLAGVPATAAAAVFAFAVPAAAASPAPAASAPRCVVQLSASDEHPTVGESITLHWSAWNAEQLTANWTSDSLPLSGEQTTTANAAGAISYQVTGLASGQYCGGATVRVVYAATSPSSASTSAPSTAPTSPTTSTSAVPTSSPATPSPSVTYPAQSPTGGSSTPWYGQPLNLLVLGLLSLFGSLALFNRGRVRAAFVRRH